MSLSYVPVTTYQPSGWHKKKRVPKHIPFNETLMKPNPDFIDERIQKIPHTKSFFEILADLFK